MYRPHFVDYFVTTTFIPQHYAFILFVKQCNWCQPSIVITPYVIISPLPVYAVVLAHTSAPFDSAASSDAYKLATIALAVIAGIAVVIIILLVVYIVKRTPNNGLYIALTDM